MEKITSEEMEAYNASLVEVETLIASLESLQVSDSLEAFINENVDSKTVDIEDTITATTEIVDGFPVKKVTTKAVLNFDLVATLKKKDLKSITVIAQAVKKIKAFREQQFAILYRCSDVAVDVVDDNTVDL